MDRTYISAEIESLEADILSPVLASAGACREEGASGYGYH